MNLRSRLETSGLSIGELRVRYAAGDNIFSMVYERTRDEELAVLLSYELQAGSYVSAIDGDKNTAVFRASMRQFGALFAKLAPRSILEAGVGEATTLAHAVAQMQEQGHRAQWVGGFDISVSRLLHGLRYWRSKHCDSPCELFCARLNQIPIEADSIDLVFTSHALEPNFGLEGKLISELYRVARHWLVLREPSFELGDEHTRAHIRKHRYVENVVGAVRDLGLEVEEHRLWGYDFNSANQTAVTVIRKQPSSASKGWRGMRFTNPRTGGALQDRGAYLYDEAAGIAFPSIEGVRCLLSEHGIVCANLPA